MNAQESTSTRPYLIRALHEWCTDNGLTPYVAVKVDDSVQVPREFVQNGEIVLNVSYDATSSLQIGNDFMEFRARFGGVPRDILVPVSRILAIYARENGQGMAFPPPTDLLVANGGESERPADTAPHKPEPDKGESEPGAAADRVVQLVTSDPDRGPDTGPPPRGPVPQGGARPSLKRVK
ncbi:MAG: ClpXP protease specificity-enhancing factor [Burkholderiaceae bacterium]